MRTCGLFRPRGPRSPSSCRENPSRTECPEEPASSSPRPPAAVVERWIPCRQPTRGPLFSVDLARLRTHSFHPLILGSSPVLRRTIGRIRSAIPASLHFIELWPPPYRRNGESTGLFSQRLVATTSPSLTSGSREKLRATCPPRGASFSLKTNEGAIPNTHAYPSLSILTHPRQEENLLAPQLRAKSPSTVFKSGAEHLQSCRRWW